MHVDGFRFDLATTLGRARDMRFDPGSSFFDAIRQDPILASVKLIAEPWDVGPGGYRLGGHGPGFSEWSDRYRDTVRAFWKGDEAILPELSARLLGSSDLFEHQGRRSWSSVNFVAAHDGFTLHDVVSYNHKHNEANGEDNRDGHDHNVSWNCGVEGPSNDPEVLDLREQQKRNMLATLLLSQGTPMLLMGDELGRSQDGNNNSYCQDNETSWLDWAGLAEHGGDLAAFVARLTQLRREHPVLRRTRFMHGHLRSPAGVKDVTWLMPGGDEMTEEAWRDPQARCIGLMLCGAAGRYLDRRGGDESDATLLIVMNAHFEPVDFRLPKPGRWVTLLDTTAPSASEDRTTADSREPITMLPRSLRVLRNAQS